MTYYIFILSQLSLKLLPFSLFFRFLRQAVLCRSIIFLILFYVFPQFVLLGGGLYRWELKGIQLECRRMAALSSGGILLCLLTVDCARDPGVVLLFPCGGILQNYSLLNSV